MPQNNEHQNSVSCNQYPHHAGLVREPDLADVVRGWWKLRGWILSGAVAGAVAALIFLAVAVPHYRVTMLVAPADRAAGADIKTILPDSASFALQYLANTIGVQDTSDFARFENIVRGAGVAEHVMGQDGVVDGVRAARAVRLVSGPVLKNHADLAAWMERHVRVEPVGTTTMRRIVIQHPDPKWAVSFLNTLHLTADNIIRTDMRGRADTRAAYLQDALRRTEHPDHRRALAGLLMEQEHLRMMLAIDEPFAAVVADRAVASARPVWPRKSIVYPIFILGGAILFYGAGLVLGRRD